MRKKRQSYSNCSAFMLKCFFTVPFAVFSGDRYDPAACPPPEGKRAKKARWAERFLPRSLIRTLLQHHIKTDLACLKRHPFLQSHAAALLCWPACLCRSGPPLKGIRDQENTHSLFSHFSFHINDGLFLSCAANSIHIFFPCDSSGGAPNAYLSSCRPEIHTW